jgi:hypothetical protein
MMIGVLAYKAPQIPTIHDPMYTILYVGKRAIPTDVFALIIEHADKVHLREVKQASAEKVSST